MPQTEKTVYAILSTRAMETGGVQVFVSMVFEEENEARREAHEYQPDVNWSVVPVKYRTRWQPGTIIPGTGESVLP